MATKVASLHYYRHILLSLSSSRKLTSHVHTHHASKSNGGFTQGAAGYSTQIARAESYFQRGTQLTQTKVGTTSLYACFVGMNGNVMYKRILSFKSTVFLYS
jgi:hypothetical protein